MPLSDPALWSRLEALSFGPNDGAFGFVDRLARDNGWRKLFAARVVEEYRRFLYLCGVAGQPVTPSDEVDQAWHLHLTCTRSYWDDLCGDVLGRPLHHEPTRGGPDQRRKYDAQYRATLELYVRQFGEAPPVDIWPDVAIRFGRSYVRIDRETAWTIDKERTRSGARHLLAAALCLGLGACAQVMDDLMTMTLIEKTMLTLFIGIVVAGLVCWALMTPEERSRQQGDGGGCGSGCGSCD